MPTSSSVPTVTFGANGFVAPAEADVLAGVQADINGAFGGGLNPALETPQGQLATTTAAIIGAVNSVFVQYTNLVDPAYSFGRMQDAIARIYFITRNPATATTVAANCNGRAGTVIPAGAVAVATDGNLYVCQSGGTIPAGGTIQLTFACVTLGPIACPATSLNQIYQQLTGWDSISNPADGTPGQNTESRADFEHRRQQSVALNSLGSLPSIQGAVLSVPNVADAYTTSNDTGSPVTIGAITIAANSVYCCVSGGDPQAVARAIWTKKMPGAGTSGNTTQTVQDTNSGYVAPLPSYTINFQTAAALPIFFAVSITNSAAVPSNAVALIQAAIVAAFAGADGGPRARIGSTIYASRFYSAVAALGSWAQIVAILIGTSGPGALNSVSVGIGQIPTILASNIAVTLV